MQCSCSPDPLRLLSRLSVDLHHGGCMCFPPLFAGSVVSILCQRPLSAILRFGRQRLPPTDRVNVASWRSLGTVVANGCRQRLLLTAVGNGCCQQHLQHKRFVHNPNKVQNLCLWAVARPQKRFGGKFWKKLVLTGGALHHRVRCFGRGPKGSC